MEVIQQNRPISTPSPLPSVTPTPLTHVVAKGEDMSGIALRYRVDLAELIKVNPTVNPRFMSIGTVLIIPTSGTPQPTGTAAASPQQTPTPVGVSIGSVSCMPARDGGLWCFQLFRNEQNAPVEGLRANIILSDAAGKTLSQTASLPLDLLPPEHSLPLIAYFAQAEVDQLEGDPRATSELLSALPNRDDGRYLLCSVQQPKVMISEDGLSAEVTLEVQVDQADSNARRIWVAAVAYDAEGQVNGVRRWEKPNDNQVPTGQSEPVTMRVYSAAGEIHRVELLAECRPSPQVRP
jgi:LysM repeat protein